MNTPVAGFDTDRETFLGLYNGMGEPDVPREGASTNSVASGRAPIASHGLDVPLAPGEEKTFIFTKVGEISSYRSGHKENAGIFCHNNPWIMIAETVIGRGDRAFEYYKKIAPAYIEEISEIHRTEPYVYSQMIAGKDAVRHGEAKNSRLTETAAWNFVAIAQSMPGVRPEYAGLLVSPCIGNLVTYAAPDSTAQRTSDTVGGVEQPSPSLGSSSFRKRVAASVLQLLGKGLVAVSGALMSTHMVIAVAVAIAAGGAEIAADALAKSIPTRNES